MLKDNAAIATIAVKNLEAAKNFYEGTLGLQKEDSREGVLSFKAGGAQLFVYESQFAGTNQATAATWVIDDVDGTVKDLKAKGVNFERYDMPGIKHEGDVHVAGEMRTAWFKDPDGNILALVSQ